MSMYSCEDLSLGGARITVYVEEIGSPEIVEMKGHHILQ